jgi:hypothetical protein
MLRELTQTKGNCNNLSVSFQRISISEPIPQSFSRDFPFLSVQYSELLNAFYTVQGSF